MARLIAQTMQQCPKTELCVSGYSQGAKVADNAANMITQALINSVVLFSWVARHVYVALETYLTTHSPS